MVQPIGNNEVRLTGAAAGRLVLSHKNRGEAFYLLPLLVRRLSGTEDEIPLLLRQRQLEALELCEADGLSDCLSRPHPPAARRNRRPALQTDPAGPACSHCPAARRR